jgi:hypothetical protein
MPQAGINTPGIFFNESGNFQLIIIPFVGFPAFLKHTFLYLEP